MLKWKIFKSRDEFVFVHADSFDEALKKVRKIDPDYNGGYVVDEEEE